MILDDFARALGQLADPRFLRVFALGILLSLASLASATLGLLWLARHYLPDPIALPFLGPVDWLGPLLGLGLVAGMLVASVFLMLPLASGLSALFADDIADAVEARHYPGLPPATRIGTLPALSDGLGFLIRLGLANLLTLIPALLFPPAAPILFLAVNGRLVGREFFRAAALRRLGRREARALASRNAAEIWLAGTLMTLPLAVPVLNLAIPVLGAASFTHLYHRLAARAPLTAPHPPPPAPPAGASAPPRARR